jgi:DNA invertase Pin-like site-specific DNA recombinase
MSPARSYIGYYRVSTARQGASGLGLEAQQESVRRFVSGRSHLIAEYTEVESGTGRHALSQRPQLRAALDHCKRLGATLVIAKLDRLSRNVRFVAELMEAKVRFVACDLPEANELTLHIMAAFAEHEAKRIGERTREALGRAKARGVQLGRRGRDNLTGSVAERRAAAAAFAERLRGQIESLAWRKLSQRQMVVELNNLGVRAPRGGRWSLSQLQRVMNRLSTRHP